ncbi:MAG: SGNH/GDSL hydrolase family protein [Myxococcaceae bacterium]
MRWFGGILLLLCACGAPPSPESDAGSDGELDAGLERDAGGGDAGFDAGFDAGAPRDAGTGLDAGMLDGGTGGTGDGGLGVLLYPTGRTHSPLTPDVVAHLQAIAALSAGKHDDVFSKVGDSNTVNTNYLSCFGGVNVDLDGRTSLDAGIGHFARGVVQGTSPYGRTSLSATIGWSAQSAIAGSPSPLQQEIDAAQPRFATVMFGTNDVGFANPDLYGRSLVTIVDTLALQGVVPVVSSIPPRDDSMTADAWVPRYNLVARAVAQSRRVPFVDLHPLLLSTPQHGLGPDGVHLNVYFPSAGARGCVFTTSGLGYGHNVRNLATQEGLDRAWRATTQGTAPDAMGPRMSGTGKRGDAIVIPSLPFVDARDTRVDGEANLASYPGCSTTNESGPEVLYRLELTQSINLRAFVVSLGTADIDLHLLSAPDSGQACLARNDKVITRALTPGTYWLSLDTYQASTGVLPGEYLLVVMAE